LIWGSISIDEKGMAFLDVEKFEALYPDLQFQVLSGTQELQETNTEQIVLFTTGGTTYVQLVPSGGYPDGNYIDFTGEVQIEALQVPGETYAGYPAIRVFSMAPTVDPNTGEPVELYRRTDHIEVVPDPYGNADQYNPPNLTIDKVDLVYFLGTSLYPEDYPEAQEHYIQPAWHFHGHDDHGSVLDIFIQALKPEYLMPEPASFSEILTASPTPSPLPPP
jgi:hypothetical protein